MFFSIEHDHFSAQALSAYDPTLRDHPFVVVQQSVDSHKCAVFACSSHAQALGIRRGQPVQQILKRHRNVEVVPRNDDIEQTAKEELAWIIESLTPEYDVNDFGRCQLNLTGTPIIHRESFDTIADRLRRNVTRTIGLADVAVGVASTRAIANMLAKLARPGNVRICEPGEETDVLASLNASLLPGLSPAVRDRIRQYGVKHVGQIQRLGKDALVVRLGGEGERLYSLAIGLDTGRNRRIEKRRTVEVEVTLDRDVNDERQLIQHVRYAADKVCHALHMENAQTQHLTFVLTYTGNRTTQKTARWPHPTIDLTTVTTSAIRLFRDLYQRRVAIKTIRLAVNRPRTDTGQFDLFESVWEKKQRDVSKAVTDVRMKLGFDAVMPAANVGKAEQAIGRAGVVTDAQQQQREGEQQALIDHLELLDEGYRG